MNPSQQELLQFVKENDVKFIRLAFCDLMGTQKNIAIMAEELPRAFEYGISFDASAITGYGTVECSDLFLVPDCSTVAILPWRPESGRVVRMFCQVRRPNGEIFEGTPAAFCSRRCSGRRVCSICAVSVRNVNFTCLKPKAEGHC